MIYGCTTGLIILHFLPALINTELFHFSTYYPYPHPSCFLRFLCCFNFPSFDYLFFYQRQAKYTENKLKAIKARNEYLLALEATNSCVFKYYIHDLSDIIDVSK